MKNSIKINFISSVYAISLFIAIELIINVYRISRVTGWSFDVVMVVIPVIILIGAAFSTLLITLCSACKKDSGLVFGEDNKTIEAFVLRRAEEGFYLVPEDDFEEGNGGDIFFAPFSKINSEYSDIQTGDFVEIFFDGYFEDIYPAEFHAIYRITETDEDYGRVSEATISRGLDKLSVLMAEDGYPLGEKWIFCRACFKTETGFINRDRLVFNIS